MTRERGSRAESKNCEILLFPTADRRQMPQRADLISGQIPHLTLVKCPEIARGGMGGGGFGSDW